MTAPAELTRASIAPQGLSDFGIVVAFLGALPDTSEGIASFLSERYVKGVPGAECDCPLYTWIRRYVAGELAVQRGHVSVTGAGYSFTVDTPVAVVEFTLDFDSGAYPFLYREGVE